MNLKKYKEEKEKFYKNVKNAELYNNFSVFDHAQNLLNKCKHHFLENDVYIYSILINIDISIDVKFPTACLTYKEKSLGTKYRIHINPYYFLFLNSIDFEYALLLCLHEVYHFLMSHLLSRKGSEENTDLKIKNIAQDLAINSIIIHYFNVILKQKPEFFPIPGFGRFLDLPKGRSYEEYESILLEMKENQQDSSFGDTVDEHEDNEGSSDGEKENDSDNKKSQKDGSGEKPQEDGNGDSDSLGSVEDQMKEIEKDEILNKCGKKPGKYTSQMIKDLINEKHGSKINPKAVLSYFVQKCSIKYNKTNSFRKVNKKYINIFPGRKVVRKPRLAIFVDQSGSVSDDLLSRFFALIDQLHCEISMFDVIPFDYEVDTLNIQKVKGFKKPEKKRTKTGGTNFQAVIDYANKSKYDGIIILTDLGCGYPTQSKMSRIWISDVNVPKFGNDINLTL